MSDSPLAPGAPPQGFFIFGDFTCRTPGVPIPASPFGLELQAPFTATGTLGIDGYDGTRRVPGTSVTVQGQGTVTTELEPASGGFLVTGYTLDVGAANPTPEPGSLLLLASRSMLVMRRLRPRRVR